MPHKKCFSGEHEKVHEDPAAISDAPLLRCFHSLSDGGPVLPTLRSEALFPLDPMVANGFVKRFVKRFVSDASKR